MGQTIPFKTTSGGSHRERDYWTTATASQVSKWWLAWKYKRNKDGK